MKDKLNFMHIFELLKYHFVFLGLVLLSFEPLLILISSIIFVVISAHSIINCNKRFKYFQKWKRLAKEDKLLFDIDAFYSDNYNWYISGSGSLCHTKKCKEEVISKKMKEWK